MKWLPWLRCKKCQQARIVICNLQDELAQVRDIAARLKASEAVQLRLIAALRDVNADLDRRVLDQK
jgi:hypothetical protein